MEDLEVIDRVCDDGSEFILSIRGGCSAADGECDKEV